MKRKLLLYLLLIYSSMNYAKVIDADTLIIRFFSWGVSDAPHLITCINYEAEVPFREYEVSDISAINLLSNELNRLQMTQEQDFSVECKLLCVKNGVVNNVICLNSEYIMINGKVYFCNKSIVNTIDTIMSKISPSIEIPAQTSCSLKRRSRHTAI